MSLRSWLEEWFGRPGKSVLRVNDGRMVAAGYFPALPTAGGDFRYALAADANGVHVCHPVGSGWAWRPTTARTYQIMQDADYTGTSNSSSAQKVFNESTNGAVTLPVGLYKMTFYYDISTTDTDSAALSLLFGGTATVSWNGWGVHSANGTTDVTGSAGMLDIRSIVFTATAVTNAVSAAKRNILFGFGGFEVTASGTLIPQYQWSSNNQASPVTRRGSWWEAELMSATTVPAGAWT